MFALIRSIRPTRSAAARIPVHRGLTPRSFAARVFSLEDVSDLDSDLVHELLPKRSPVADFAIRWREQFFQLSLDVANNSILFA
jgi:hypothetical protein